MCVGAGRSGAGAARSGAGAGALDRLGCGAGAEIDGASDRDGVTGASGRDWAGALGRGRGAGGGSSEDARGAALASPTGIAALTDATGKLGGPSPRADELELATRETAKEQANIAHADRTMSGLRRPTRALRRVAGWAPSLPVCVALLPMPSVFMPGTGLGWDRARRDMRQSASAGGVGG